MRNPAYRARQLLSGFRTTLGAGDAAAVRARLSDRELVLFLRMHPRDRAHCVRVMRWLERRDEPSDDVLAAALLHDVAKGQPRVWERVLFALVETVSPRLVDRLTAEHGARWRRALWLLRHHPRLGAGLLREAGARARVVELVERHTEARREATADGAEDELARLIAADSAC